MLVREKTYSLVDKVFWFSLIIFLNPGGIQESFGMYDSIVFSGKRSINLNDFLFVILMGCFLAIKVAKYELKDSRKISKYLIIFSIYYFLVFGMITPLIRNSNTDLLSNLIKLRHSFYYIFLFFMVYSFSKRSWMLFWKSFLYSSVIILFLFLQSFFTNINVLSVQLISRGFLSLERVLLVTYGFLPFLTAIGAIVMIFKFKTSENRWIILGFFLMTVSWVLSLTRRHIIGTVIYFVLSILLFQIIKKKDIKYFLTAICKISIVTFVLLIIISTFFPKYVVGIGAAIRESVNVVVFGEESTGRIDERLSFFGRKKMVEEFSKAPIFGTGFYNLWRTDVGDELGFEAADYPFQSALAMSGIMGCFIFLPVYVVLFKVIVKDIKHFKFFLLKDDVRQLILLSIILFFLYEYIQYVNWFHPLSNAGQSRFYFLLGLYCGIRENYYGELQWNKKS